MILSTHISLLEELTQRHILLTHTSSVYYHPPRFLNEKVNFHKIINVTPAFNFQNSPSNHILIATDEYF